MKQLKSIFSRKCYTVPAIIMISFILLQFIGPTVSNPPVTHPILAPEKVTQILKRACYDCHSNETSSGWTSKVAPFSWIVFKDVRTARSRFNLSTWDTLTAAQQQGLVWEMVNMVLDNKMPLPSYRLTHPAARLSETDIEVLKNYAVSLNPPRFHDTAAVNAAVSQYCPSVAPDNEQTPVAANGVRYIKDYRNWQVISTTNRFDNNRSIRIIYANPVAVQAIKNNQIKPWPEGSIIVKVVWDIIEEKNGDILPGKFNNVQIMIKDSKRFEDSEGWGFAKFTGTGHVPYGEKASFNATCFNCHKAASDNGYVFNVPLPDGDLLPANHL